MINQRLLNVQFAADHVLTCRRGNFLYSYIPKNACSSVQAAIVLADHPEIVARYASEEDLYDHIHRYTPYLVTKTQTELRQPMEHIVVLRDPVDRIISAYYNKFVQDIDERITENLCRAVDKAFEDMSFNNFVDALMMRPNSWIDHHFCAQSEFLFFNRYDHYFMLEERDSLSDYLALKLGRPLPEANRRPRAAEAADYLGDRPANSFFEACSSGEPAPAFGGFLNDAALEKIAQRYADDFNLYGRVVKNKTGIDWDPKKKR